VRFGQLQLYYERWLSLPSFTRASRYWTAFVVVFRRSVLDSVFVAFFVFDLFPGCASDAPTGSWVDLDLLGRRSFSEGIVGNYIFVVINV
jgi:hypothetical protein